jgi:hypothetical protein
MKWDREAPEQEAVAEAFECNNWPDCIQDPLKQVAGMCPKERLRDTLKRMNKKLPPGTISFHANGHGGVRWRIVEE